MLAYFGISLAICSVVIEIVTNGISSKTMIGISINIGLICIWLLLIKLRKDFYKDDK